MSLSATRSRRSNAGNRWAEALAAVQLENGDAPDPDAEVPGEEFVGKEGSPARLFALIDDVFESDFESTDEEEYAKEGIEDGERQVQMEEKAERRAARTKASKSGAAPTQKILERAMKGQPAPRKKRTSMKSTAERKSSLLWDATRQSERASTVKHKFQVQERLMDAEKRKAHAPRRPRPVVAAKTQDELIAAALELEEKNTKALQEFLEKEEEKRAAARKVVRLKIEGPVVRWVSRGEVPLVEEIKREQGVSEKLVVPQGQYQAPVAQAATAQTSIAQTPTVEPPATQAPKIRIPVVDKPPPPEGTPSNTGLDGSNTPLPAPTSAPVRASTPQRTQRMQVYVEIPTPSKSMRRSLSSSTQGSLVSRGHEGSPAPLASRGLGVPSSQPLVRSPLSSTVSLPRSPLSNLESLVPEGDNSQTLTQPAKSGPSQPPGPSPRSAPISLQHLEPRLPISSQPDPLRSSHRPTAIRQSSASSSGSGKSKGKMVMYVEIPVWKKDGSGAPASGPVETLGPNSSGLLLEPSSDLPAPVSSAPPPSAHTIPEPPNSSVVVPPSSSLPVLSPTLRPIPTVSASSKPILPPPQKESRNYVIVEYGGGARASFGWNMQAVFGNHADWEDIMINGIKATHPVKPICAITGLPAPYRDSRTGLPYANAYAYRTLTRLLAHEFIWSKERGCYVGDEGKDPAKSVPSGWKSAAVGRF